jgi:hypothetical protein
MTMEKGVEEIIEQVVANKRTLIRLLKDKIKEFQDLTWGSVPKSYPLRCVYEYVLDGAGVTLRCRHECVWNGAAVRWRRRYNQSRWYPDGYGEIMEKPHDAINQIFDYEYRIDPVDLEQLPPLELACFAEHVLKVLKEAIKEELLKKEGR